MTKAFDEAALRKALGKLDAKKALNLLAPATMDGACLGKLLAVLRRGGLPLVKHADEARRARRDHCLEAIAALVEARAGASDAAAFRALGAMIGMIESVYQAIVDSSLGSEAGTLTPEQRAAAILAFLGRGYRDNADAVMTAFARQELMDPLALRVGADDGGAGVDPEAVLDSLVRMATSSLLMEGHQQRWFDDAGALALPPLPEVDAPDVETVWPTLFYAQSWRFWEDLEETCRYFGGTIAKAEGEALPEAVRAAGIGTMYSHESVALDWEALDLASHARLFQALAQNRQEMEAPVSRNVGLRDARGTASLPPETFLSVEEVHAHWSLERALGLSVIGDRTSFRGLRLVEWVRGYAALQALAMAAIEEDGPGGDMMPVMPRKRVLRRLTELGLRSDRAAAFVTAVTFGRKSRDLFDTPIIHVGDDQLLLCGPALVSTIISQAILSRFSSLGISLEARGKAFEAAMLAMFRGQGLRAEAVETKVGKEIYDFDILLRWDPYLFLFECKSRTLPGSGAVPSYYFRDDIGDQVVQVERLVAALPGLADLLDAKLGAGASALQLVPCVLHALPFSMPPENGIHFVDASAISRFFESGAFNRKMFSGERTLVIPGHRIWAGDAPTADDFLRQIVEQPQLALAIAEIEQRLTSARLAPDMLAVMTKVVREPVPALERDQVLASLS